VAGAAGLVVAMARLGTHNHPGLPWNEAAVRPSSAWSLVRSKPIAWPVPTEVRPMGKPDLRSVDCPHCGAGNLPDLQRCCHCGRPLATKAWPNPGDANADTPAPAQSAATSASRTFRIDSLMLIVAVIAICLGIAHEAPLFGITFAAAAIPALLLTIAFVRRRRSSELPLSIFQKIRVFLLSLAAVGVVEVSASIAFCTVCFPLGVISFNRSNATGMFVAFVLGAIAAVFAGGFTTRHIRKIWLKRRRT
jgi:hypothetical protein